MKTSITKQNKQSNKAMYFVVALIWLALWEAAAIAINEEVLFVPPHKVACTLFKFVQNPEFWKSVLFSVLRVISGFLIGYIVTTVLAFAAFRNRFIMAFLSPAVSVIKATPVASFIILILMWAGKNFVPVIICSLMVVPIVWSNMLEGMKNIDRKLLEMAYVFRMTPLEKLKNIYIPSLIPYNAASVSSGLGLCWKAGIAAEVICRTVPSIGNSIWETKFYILTDEMFAWTTAVILLSVLFDKLVKLLPLSADVCEEDI